MIALVISSAVCHSFLPNWFPGNITLQTQPAPHSLPKDFKWGYASAAFQVEGAVNEDKRSPSVWDVFTANSSNIVDGENATTTVDEYHSYTDIIKILKDSGANTYRLSIAWSRLIPSGFAGGRVNRLAVAHYNSVINTLIENRIEPMVTLYHWDLPQVLFEAYGGVTNYERFPDDFAYFAEKSFELFGDRVKYWITFNEPISYCVLGYGEGKWS